MKTKFLLHFFAHVFYVFILLHKSNILCIHSLSAGHSERYCGSSLPQTLDSLCSQYQDNNKRSSPIENDYFQTKQLNPFLNERYALSSFFRRNRRDPASLTVRAYSECCAKGCTINELTQYCAVSS